MESKNLYGWPVKRRSIKVYKNRKPVAHKGKLRFALDFMVDVDTEILAAQNGIVVYVKQNSNNGDNDMKFWDDGNRIVIAHENGEYSAYEHIRFDGSVVEIGDEVEKGQLIAYSGATGFLGPLGPHLHFEIFIEPSSDQSEGERTMKPRFEINPGRSPSRQDQLGFSGSLESPLRVGIE